MDRGHSELVAVKVYDGLVVAAAGNEDAGEDGVVIEKRRPHELRVDPVRAHHVLCALQQARLRCRASIIERRLVQVVVGLDDVPAARVVLGVPEHRRAAAQARHQRRGRDVLTASVHRDHCSLVGLGAGHDEVRGRHEVQVVKLRDSRLKVRDRLHDLPHGELVALAAAEDAGKVGRVLAVEADVVLKAPSAIAHGCVEADRQRPLYGCYEGLPRAKESDLDGDLGEMKDSAFHLHLETS
mmetsp:Transcript_75436/g.174896  ORF Transcript_75436/g.174896 Transcript_75436/m.174896 type:complete len:240 (+) Transcript_75436:155-874(+)